MLYSCHKNASKADDLYLRQTESVTVSVSPWEIERPVDPMEFLRHSSYCVVPEGKIGSYGHRSLVALMMGCAPRPPRRLPHPRLLHKKMTPPRRPRAPES